MSKTVSWKERVSGAIATLKARGGSSLPAIKKALGADPKQWRFINAALKSGVAKGDFTKNGGKYKVVKKAAPKKKKPKKKKAVKKKKKAKKKKAKKPKKKAKKKAKKKTTKKKAGKKKATKKKKGTKKKAKSKKK